MLYPESYIARLIFRHFRGDISPAESAQLNEWLSASAANRQFFESITSEDALAAMLAQLEKDKAEGVEALIFEKVQQRIAEAERGRVRKMRPGLLRWTAAAAVVLLVGGASWYALRKAPEQPGTVMAHAAPLPNDVLPGSNKAVLTLSDGRQIQLDPDAQVVIDEMGFSINNRNGELLYDKAAVAVMNTMTTPRGGQYKVVLSDGTQVWMNSESSVSYPTRFEGKTREILVTGEVYLEVAKNKQQPFVVKMPGGSTIEVLGTSFNVNTYPDESAQVTTLVDGSIRLSYGTEKVMMTPGQQAVLANQPANQHLMLQAANIEQALAWKNNFFVFNKADLPMVLRQLSRWYDLDVVYKGKVPVRSFQGKIPRDLPLSKVLGALEKLDVDFQVRGNTLIVSPDK